MEGRVMSEDDLVIEIKELLETPDEALDEGKKLIKKLLIDQYRLAAS